MQEKHKFWYFLFSRIKPILQKFSTICIMFLTHHCCQRIISRNTTGASVFYTTSCKNTGNENSSFNWVWFTIGTPGCHEKWKTTKYPLLGSGFSGESMTILSARASRQVETVFPNLGNIISIPPCIGCNNYVLWNRERWWKKKYHPILRYSWCLNIEHRNIIMRTCELSMDHTVGPSFLQLVSQLLHWHSVGVGCLIIIYWLIHWCQWQKV